MLRLFFPFWKRSGPLHSSDFFHMLFFGELERNVVSADSQKKLILWTIIIYVLIQVLLLLLQYKQQSNAFQTSDLLAS